MKKIYTTDSLVAVQHLKNLLEQEGIACLVKNDQMFTLGGGIPFTEVWPQLWVSRDGDVQRAGEIVAEHVKGPSPDLPQWDCPGCGEKMDGQFTACWHCGGERPRVD